MSNLLPSYQEAVDRPDWLNIVAPYVPVKSYAALCRVAARFYRQFAPRLWNDPLRAVRTLGLQPHDDLDWYFWFIHKHIPTVRRRTLRLVTTIDFRGFAITQADFYFGAPGRSVPETLRLFPVLFPCLRCIRLDGHPEFDPGPLALPSNPEAFSVDGFEHLLFLSLAGSREHIPLNFFASPYLRSIQYLDVSDIPGSLKSALVQGTLQPGLLPNLRILKARGREMDDSTAILLCSTFMDRLWSLDLSRNQLTDLAVSSIVSHSLPSASLRSDMHFDVEGKLSWVTNAGSDNYGYFRFIEESETSATFTHPDRYLVDAPAYYPDSDRPPQEALNLRNDGRSKMRHDRPQDLLPALSGGLGSLIPSRRDVVDLCAHQWHNGITHLYLNNTYITAAGLERLLWLSGGHLEHLECESPKFAVHMTLDLPDWISRLARVDGFLGAAHLLRPVISSNLRSLRIHHSIFTHTPTLVADNMTTLSSLWLAETFLRPKAELTYPQAFTPDMNPRLQSLTLTKIPRRSTGPLIDKLLTFLHLAAEQESAIRKATSTSRRGPSVLTGLRHIRLEFEPDPVDELDKLMESAEVDAGALLSSGADEFSFFGDAWGDSKPSTTDNHNSNTSTSGDGDQTTPQSPPPLPPRPTSSQSDDPPAQQATHEPYTATYRSSTFTIPIFTGAGLPSTSPAFDLYRHNLSNPSLRTDPRPAAPYHVIAGVPPGSYVYGKAWDAMFGFRDGEQMRKPTQEELRFMVRGDRDVLQRIRRFREERRWRWEEGRRKGREGDGMHEMHDHGHWSGKLEVVLSSGAARYQSSEYWR